MEQFTNLYQLSKTLRFELKPIGKTLEYIKQNGLLQKDFDRAKSYIEVKKIIDEYHKNFITTSLSCLTLKFASDQNNDSISEYYSLYLISKKNDIQKKEFGTICSKLRKQIADRFTKSDIYKSIDKKELIKKHLFDFVRTDKERELITEFKDFTTYFSGFHENRKNMYSAEEKSTAIAFRLINENLPKFIDNIAVFQKLVNTDVVKDLTTIYSELHEYMNVKNIRDFFQLEYYSDLLTQLQIEVYNAIIGGKTLNDGAKIKGLNEYINLYNHKQSDKSRRLPKLKPLYKQILSDREVISFLPEEFKTDNETLESIEQFYNILNDLVLNPRDGKTYSIKSLLKDLNVFNLDKVYIQNDVQLTDLSQKTFKNWDTIQKALEYNYYIEYPQKTNTAAKYEENKNNFIKRQSRFSISYINKGLAGINTIKKIQDYFISGGVNDTQNQDIFDRIESAYSKTKDLLNTPYPEDKELSQDKANIEKVKNLLDTLKELQHFVKPLLCKEDEADKDEHFYGELVAFWKELDNITPLYNKVRNRMTRKPYLENKIKLNFENKSNFLGGWVDSKTEHSDNGTQSGGYLFRKKNDIGEYDYYLGISSDAKLLRDKGGNTVDEYERLNYYQPKSASIYGNSYAGENSYNKDKGILILVIEEFVSNIYNPEIRNKIENDFNHIKSEHKTPSKLIAILLDKYNEEYHKLLSYDNFISENRRITKNLHKTICSLIRIPKSQNYTSYTFSLFTEAQKVIENLCKEKVFEYFNVGNNEIEQLQDRKEKPLLLFQITNKDLSFAENYSKGLRKSRGTENLHTMYFKALMEGNQNILDIGTGAVFYREKTKGLKQEPTHYANEKLINKNEETKKNKPISIFSYDIIKDRRYTVDKFQFHMSIIQNYQQPQNCSILNHDVNQYLKDSKATHIIGIDRGERHLLYLTLIDLHGNIKEQYSLNEIINGYRDENNQYQEYRTNYHDLLSQREKKRNESRKSWQTIESIRDLKEGYLSQVIHKITQLMIEYKAIVVLEDLNLGFMRGRQKFEKQVYQKFEKMLIDKLNYLADKKKLATEVGGILNAYQLTNKFNSFKKLGNQSGFLFYVPAWNTSKMDPTTGFVNLFDTRYETIEKSKNFFKKFKNIAYNSEKNYFEFEFDYKDFTTRAEGTQTQWTVCTNGDRIESFRDPENNNTWNSRYINLTDSFIAIFNTKGISTTSDIKNNITAQADKEFFKNLLHLFKLTLQMRNSEINSKIDYLISPVKDEEDEFYDSRACGDNSPKNADANGAYNIARKGLWVIDQIKGTNDLAKPKLAISNKEWLTFAQNKPYLENN